MDEVATAASLSWGDGSSSDGIADDVSAAAAGSDAMMDDAVLDELQDDGVGGGGSSSGGDILDEVAGDLSWAQAESDFAEALAGASDIDEILADGVPLPSDDAATAPITEEIAPVSSSAATTSVESVLDEQLSGTPDSVSVEDDAVAVSSAASDPDDADVSSVMPASSTTASDTAVRRHYGGSSSNHDETDSEESALDALECDMHEGKPRRVKALESVHPSAFSPLYAADETETTATDTQASEEKVHSSDSETSQECVLRATGQDVGVLESAAIAADVVLPPRSEQVAASAPPSDVATDRPSHSTALREYAADDLVAQLEWKERQLSLFRQLRPKSVWAEEGDEKDADATEPVEGKADYHWGMLETLLQCRFGGESAYNYDDEEDADERDDADDGSGWTDADEVSGVNGQSSIDVSADAEYSDAVA
ncbi:putative RNA-binding protein [Trypanosoma grayi]|uniref:putative RNA-binding protein n=1 Tax=Trypanosoma grayi TaxID=71804 RepID=UPI0004F4BD93|nr:putative RNA-binding protein [Trypanosoma grayi]KEG11892.1 putative RNA-binding protein [Trypanosoma grayi]